MTASPSDPVFLTLPEIAGWQIETSPAIVGATTADLPALQRGAIWRVRQIEELWDSILRGFPIGAFTISPPEASLGRQEFKFQSPKSRRKPATHLLLDGQQRATAIALAFDATCYRRDSEAKAALWIDISAPPKGNERQFIFRVLTRAHPWGYSRTNPGDRLGSSAIRAAIRCFRTVLDNPGDEQSTKFALSAVWPWDAVAPVPVALLIQATIDHPNNIDAAMSQLRDEMQALPFLAGEDSKASLTDPIEDHDFNRYRDQRLAVKNLFDESHSENSRLRRVLNRFQSLLNKDPYCVPALVMHVNSRRMSNDGIGHELDNHYEAGKDDVELLFIRLNASGTTLTGEELVYSLIKARWPEVAQWMHDLPRRPAVPSRVAAMCVRLVLARKSAIDRKVLSDKAYVMPAMPSMADFRRHLSDENFSMELKRFLDNDAEQLLGDAWDFLTLAGGPTSKPDFRLLPTQVVDIAQRSPDVFLLLLRWLDRLREKGISADKLDEKLHRRTLGFLTALAWFAPNKERACAAVWKGLEDDGLDNRKLLNRFNATRFKAACRLDQQARLQMIPLPSPETLGKVCNRFIKRRHKSQAKAKATIFFPDGMFWTDENWWYEQFAPALQKEVHSEWHSRLDVTKQLEADGAQEFTAEAAYRFLNSLHEGTETFLVYAQRECLQRWYPDFDPSLPEMIEDSNRPWDWDHILPGSLIKGKHKIPQSVRDWINSIGNLRAWPFEANRSDGNMPPIRKLDSVLNDDRAYGHRDPIDIRRSSFINESIDWPHWKNCAPLNPNKTIEDMAYLSNKYVSPGEWHVDYSVQRTSAVTAIILRFVEIYANWYVHLRIKDLQ